MARQAMTAAVLLMLLGMTAAQNGLLDMATLMSGAMGCIRNMDPTCGNTILGLVSGSLGGSNGLDITGVMTQPENLRLLCAETGGCQDAYKEIITCLSNVTQNDRGAEAYDELCGCLTGDVVDTACVEDLQNEANAARQAQAPEVDFAGFAEIAYTPSSAYSASYAASFAGLLALALTAAAAAGTL